MRSNRLTTVNLFGHVEVGHIQHLGDPDPNTALPPPRSLTVGWNFGKVSNENLHNKSTDFCNQTFEFKQGVSITL